MSNQSRRKLLKSIAAGSGAVVAGKALPESWSKPVVDSVMLPAHAQTSPPPVADPESNASQTSNCAVGRYAFSTVRDGKVHFEASFLQGGMIQFYLKNGPTGSWTYSGDRISVTGPVGNNRSVITLNFTVTKVASDCKVLEFVGRSQGGSDMRIYRI